MTSRRQRASSRGRLDTRIIHGRTKYICMYIIHKSKFETLKNWLSKSKNDGNRHSAAGYSFGGNRHRHRKYNTIPPMIFSAIQVSPICTWKSSPCHDLKILMRWTDDDSFRIMLLQTMFNVQCVTNIWFNRCWIASRMHLMFVSCIKRIDQRMNVTLFRLCLLLMGNWGNFFFPPKNSVHRN